MLTTSELVKEMLQTAELILCHII